MPMIRLKSHLSVIATLFLSNVCFAQLSDSFDDGDFTNNPVWTGITENFIVNDSQQLQLNDDEASTSYLLTSFAEESLDNKEWQFWIKQSFSGSGNNNSRFYLAFSGTDLTYDGDGADGQGYFIQFGEAGSADAIRLFRNDDAVSAPFLIASGPDAQVASSFEIRVKVTRDDSGNWEILADESGGEAFEPIASGSDATYTSTSNLGVACKYTSSNATKFYFDDIYFGAEIVDLEPPIALNVLTLSGNSIDIFFNENMDQTSAENTSNYTIAGITVSNAELDGGYNGLVHLETSALTEGQNYTLEISGVQDLAGNEVTESDWPILWDPPATPQAGNIRITEILADPTPVIGLPDFEFVEILNMTSETFDLGELEFTNSGNPVAFPTYLMAGGEYVIVCHEDNIDAFTPFGNVVGLPTFSALSNEADDIGIYGPGQGFFIDAVSYEDSWHTESNDGGVTLELTNPELNCASAINWQSSANAAGGTPGEQNSLWNPMPDTTAPILINASFASPNQIVLNYDEALDGVLSEDDFNLSPSIDIILVSEGESAGQIVIDLAADVEFNTLYTLTVTSVSDCNGNAAPSTDVELFLFDQPDEGMLVITEIMADPDEGVPSPNAEFVEVYNRGSFAVDLGSTTLNGVELPSYGLQPGEYVVLLDEQDLGALLLLPNKAGVAGFPSLTNGGMELELAIDATILDRVTYDDAWYNDSSKDDGGWSLERIDLEIDCNDRWNWAVCQSLIGATAGAENSVAGLEPAVPDPEALHAYHVSEGIYQIAFGVAINTPNLDQISLIETSTGNETGHPIIAVIIASELSNRLEIWCDPLPANSQYSFELTGIETCYGGLADSRICVHALGEIEEQQLTLNEVLFNPYSGGQDYLEIYNAGSGSADMSQWSVAFSENGILEDLAVVAQEGLLLCNENYLCLTRDAEVQTTLYPQGDSRFIYDMNDLPSLPNDGGTIELLFNEEVHDSFDYSEDIHSDIVDDTDGISLEKIHPLMDSNSPSSWHSAAASFDYGTPGTQNSQFTPLNQVDGEVSLETQIFSPDNDGYQDFCLVHYAFDDPGLIGSLTVFDAAGRTIKRAVSNELLAATGSMQWDGSAEDNSKAPVGSYVLYFEAFTTDGEVFSEKLVAVLAAGF